MPSRLHAGHQPALRHLLGKGFRPFFALAAAFASLSLPLWLFALRGEVRPGGSRGAMHWHAHEMVFGFTMAVIAGFLLTAVGNWTKRETATGTPLLLLSSIWLAGRIAMLAASSLPPVVVTLADLAFIPALAIAIGRPLIATGNRRNFVFLPLLLALFAANAASHAPAWGRLATLVAVDLIILIIVIITGRIIPMFTRNATGHPELRSSPWLDRATSAALVLTMTAELLLAPNEIRGPLLGVAAVLAAARTRHWGIAHVWRNPMLWILHLGYLFVPLGLLLRAVATFTPVSPVIGLHALTAGAIGCLTLGMMARVSRGHTGRPIATPPSTTVAFIVMISAAAIRVFVPLVDLSWYRASLLASGSLWALAFLIYTIAYWPILSTPRVDGRPG